MAANNRAILLALAATALFTVASAMVKHAVLTYPVLQILFIRQIVVGLSALPSAVRTFPHSLKTQYPGWHAIRIAGAFTALSMGIWAVAVLPLTTATALAFSQVFFVVLLAALFLKERTGTYRMTAIVIGFIGVLVVIRPATTGMFDIGSLIAITGALGAAVAIISVRKLSQTESTETLLSYQALFVGLASGIAMLWLWLPPTLADIAFMLGIGIVATIGQWLGIMALRAGEASVVGSIEFMKLVYAAILAFLFFSEIPDKYTLAGAALIVLSALFMLKKES
ncbi:MAG: DMT family transporter [Granulosicoccus sp.]